MTEVPRYRPKLLLREKQVIMRIGKNVAIEFLLTQMVGQVVHHKSLIMDLQ